MADQLVVYPSLVRFYVPWLQTQLDARTEPYANATALPREPEGDQETWPDLVVVVRFDGDVETSVITTEADLGVSIYGGTKVLPQDADDLAALVRALIRSSARVEPGNPIAAVTRSTGPLPVDDDGAKALRYLTFTVVVAGAVL